MNVESSFKDLAGVSFDIVVIGGGITGAGIALDSSLRGYKVLIIDSNDFASGTSSRSTKLIHGGLRYLKNLEFKLVHDVGVERRIVYNNAINLVRPERMMIPFYKNGSLSKFSAGLALFLYDSLAKVSKKERRVMMGPEETLAKEPSLNHENLLGSGLYYEYRTDDSRLTISLLLSAQKQGCKILNYCSLQSFSKTNNQITGVSIKNSISHEVIEIKASIVINATGVWVDNVMNLDTLNISKKANLICFSKGIHIVFPYEKLPVKQSLYFDAIDKRMIFCIPRDGFTYIGTTDLAFPKAEHNPLVSKEEVLYLIQSINATFQQWKVKESDIVSSWCGLRPLINKPGKSFKELSRKDEIFVSDSGLITIAGGKLTGFRLMAEKVANMVNLKQSHSTKCRTRQFKLEGCDFSNEEDLKKKKISFCSSANSMGIYNSFAESLFWRYGTRAELILDIYKSLDISSQGNLKILIAELEYCIKYEWVKFLEDFIQRRSSYLYFDKFGVIDNYLDALNDYLCNALNYPPDLRIRSLVNTKELINNYRQTLF